MDEQNRDETDASKYQTEYIGKLFVFNCRNHCSPNDRADCLYRKQDTYPVGSILILDGLSVENYFRYTSCHCFYRRSIKDIQCHSSIGVSPHKHEGCPTKELHQAYCPESFRGFDQ